MSIERIKDIALELRHGPLMQLAHDLSMEVDRHREIEAELLEVLERFRVYDSVRYQGDDTAERLRYAAANISMHSALAKAKGRTV